MLVLLIKLDNSVTNWASMQSGIAINSKPAGLKVIFSMYLTGLIYPKF